MNVLVTGSNGFIGSHVCEYLKEQGEYVIGIGRHSESLFPVDEYHVCDLDTDSIFEIKFGKKIDYIVHLAADMRKDPHCIEVVSANCTGEQRLLEYCEKNDIKVMVQLSSLPVIGKPMAHPIMDDHPVCPPTVYHATKVMEELLADFAYRNKGIRTASFRISAPVGARMNPKTIFPVFVNAALENKDINLYGKGTRKQSYVHVKDIAQALYKAAHSEKCHGVYNLSSFNLISNVDLAGKIIQVLNSQSHINFVDKPDPADNDVWDPSLEKLIRDTGYEPLYDIETAIKDYADYLKK